MILLACDFWRVVCAQEPTPALPALLLAPPVTTCTGAEERLLVPANLVPLGATAAQASAAVSNELGRVVRQERFCFLTVDLLKTTYCLYYANGSEWLIAGVGSGMMIPT